MAALKTNFQPANRKQCTSLSYNLFKRFCWFRTLPGERGIYDDLMIGFAVSDNITKIGKFGMRIVENCLINNTQNFVLLLRLRENRLPGKLTSSSKGSPISI